MNRKELIFNDWLVNNNYKRVIIGEKYQEYFIKNGELPLLTKEEVESKYNSLNQEQK